MDIRKAKQLGLLSLSLALYGNFQPNIYKFFSKKSDNKSENTRTFLWGNGVYQSRPDQAMTFDNFEPKEIENFKKGDSMSKLAFHEHLSAGIMKNGNVVFWKSHQLQSSKDPEINDNIRKFQVLQKNSNIKQIAFTKGFLWGVHENGKVFQWAIDSKTDLNNEIISIQISDKNREIQSLQNIDSIACGYDHVLALTKDGKLYAMGDDTYGQCGVNQDQRIQTPPFFEKRIRKAQLIPDMPKIKKVVCGSSHSLALTETGDVLGWGSNQKVQLSHEVDFSKVEAPIMAYFRPVKIDHNMKQHEILDMAAGHEFSVFVTRNRVNDETEVFSCGHNLNGELGIGYLRHVADNIKVEGLSNFQIKDKKEVRQVKVDKLQCGNYHCMAHLSVGVLMQWGYNEQGQMGNKKRSTIDHPVIINKFSKEKVQDIFAGYNKSAVICDEI